MELSEEQKIAFNKYVNKNENISLTWSSNEILIKNDIDLHKYLKKMTLRLV